MTTIFDRIRSFSFKLHKNEYTEAFEVSDYDSEVKNDKSKMADLK